MTAEPLPDTPVSFAEQWQVFSGFCLGASSALSADLWACTDGPTLFIDEPKRGVRSHRLYRVGLLKLNDLSAAMRALLDSRHTWPTVEPLGDLPADATIYRA